MRFPTKAALFFALTAAIALCGCSDSDETGGNPSGPVTPPFEEPVPEQVVFTNANLVYYGDDGYTETSVSYELSLYTDMQIDDMGNPIGPGKLMRISFNAEFPKEGEPLALPAGRYNEPFNSGAFPPFTFNEGYLDQLNLPTGLVELPRNSFYGDLAAGTTEYTPDLLREGFCDVKQSEDGTYTVEGILVGTQFMKRYFSFKGQIEVVDRSEEDGNGPNSNLKGDILLGDIEKARIEDLGNPYYLDGPDPENPDKPNNQSYRAFRLYLAEQGVDLTGEYPSGSGKWLQIRFFVPYDTDVREGVPAGKYTMTQLEDGGYIDRWNIVPFNIVPGTPDLFTPPTGTWYQRYAGEFLRDYARIDGGTMTVSRTADGGHTFEIDFTDCSSVPFHVRCNRTFPEPIPVYEKH